MWFRPVEQELIVLTLVLSNNSGGSINLGAAVAYCMVLRNHNS